ncbi:hypothetical protein BDW66DRAFT_138131 [Aspergillus desertorum]
MAPAASKAWCSSTPREPWKNEDPIGPRLRWHRTQTLMFKTWMDNRHFSTSSSH